MSIGFEDCKVYISNVDSQSSAEGGIIVQVSTRSDDSTLASQVTTWLTMICSHAQVLGEQANSGGPWRKFAQTFFLAEQPNGYFVLNDICRYLKEELYESEQDGPDQSQAQQESGQPVAEQHQQPPQNDSKNTPPDGEEAAAAAASTTLKHLDHHSQPAQQVPAVSAAAAQVPNGDAHGHAPADDAAAAGERETEVAVAQEAIPEAFGAFKADEVSAPKAKTNGATSPAAPETATAATEPESANVTSEAEPAVSASKQEGAGQDKAPEQSAEVDQASQTDKTASAVVGEVKKDEQVAAPAPAAAVEPKSSDKAVEKDTVAATAPVQDKPATSKTADAASQASTAEHATKAASAPAPTPAVAPAPAPVPAPAPAAPKTWASLAASNTKSWGSHAIENRVGASSGPSSSTGTTTPTHGSGGQQHAAASSSIGGPAAASSSAGASFASASASSQGKGKQPASALPPLVDAVLSIHNSICFVKGVAEHVPEDLLRRVFSTRFGPIRELDVIRSKACAFVEFERVDSARRAIQASLRPQEGGEGGVPLGQGNIVHLVERKKPGERPAPRPHTRSGTQGSAGANMSGGGGGDQQQQQQHTRGGGGQQQQGGGRNASSASGKAGKGGSGGAGGGGRPGGQGGAKGNK